MNQDQINELAMEIVKSILEGYREMGFEASITYDNEDKFGYAISYKHDDSYWHRENHFDSLQSCVADLANSHENMMSSIKSDLEESLRKANDNFYA